jgi:hypothetical protein
MQASDLRESALLLLREVFEGPVDPAVTWVVENDRAAGLFGTVDALTAEEASLVPAGRSSVAAHVNHIRFFVRQANAYAAGEEPDQDWEGSWRVQRVDPQSWADLRAELRSEYDRLLANAEEVDLTVPEMRTGMISLVAHAAYHLGAIRQIAIRHAS